MKNLQYPKAFETREKLEKWLDKNEIEFQSCYIFSTRYYSYVDEKGFEHLYCDGKELTAGIKAKDVFVYYEGNWEYDDENGYLHQFDKNNNQIL